MEGVQSVGTQTVDGEESRPVAEGLPQPQGFPEPRSEEALQTLREDLRALLLLRLPRLSLVGRGQGIAIERSEAEPRPVAGRGMRSRTDIGH